MQGSCLCGAVSVSADDHYVVGACHCSMCRRWGGGPLLAVQAGIDVKISGDYSVYASSTWAERGFCPVCGTHLFYRLTQGLHYSLPVGLFQDQRFDLQQEIFIDEKPDYYDFKNITRQLTGKQVIELYGG